jgi:hypothetical protein
MTTETKIDVSNIKIEEYHIHGNDKIRLVVTAGNVTKQFWVTERVWVPEPRELYFRRIARSTCQLHGIGITRAGAGAGIPSCNCEMLITQLEQKANEDRDAHGIDLAWEQASSVVLTRQYPPETKDELANPLLDIWFHENKMNFDAWDGAYVDNIPTQVNRRGKQCLTVPRRWVGIPDPSYATYALVRYKNFSEFHGALHNKVEYSDAGNNFDSMLPRCTRIETCEACRFSGEFVRLIHASSSEEAEMIWQEYHRPFNWSIGQNHFHGENFSGLGKVIGN